MKIETDRLIIQRFNLSKIEQFKNIIKDFNSSKYAIFDRPFPKNDGEIEELAKKFSNNDLFFEVDKKDNLEMIGYICFNVEENNYDIGYCFNSHYFKKGYAVESCQALLKWITNNYNIYNFTAGTAIENIPSVNLLKKLGFKLVRIEKMSFQKDNNGNDIVFNGGCFELCINKC